MIDLEKSYLPKLFEGKSIFFDVGKLGKEKKVNTKGWNNLDSGIHYDLDAFSKKRQDGVNTGVVLGVKVKGAI